MAALAFDLDRKMVRRRHQRARPDREFAERNAGIIVHPVDFLDPEARHQAVVDHGLAAGAAFFRRLEDHDRGAAEIAGLGEIFGGAKQHRGVPVMAAGMHLSGHRRLVRQTGRLLDRQRVHVGAHADGLAAAGRLLALDDADNAGAPDPRHHLVAAEGFQLFGDARGRPVHVILQLRMHMQVAPPLGDLGVELGDAIDDRHDGQGSRQREMV